MSLQELEKIKFDWSFATPSYKTQKRYASRTCVVHVSNKELNIPKIIFRKDPRNPNKLKKKYGSLRSV